MKTYYVAYEGTKNNPTAILACVKESPLGIGEIIYKESTNGLKAYNAALPSVTVYVATLNLKFTPEPFLIK